MLLEFVANWLLQLGFERHFQFVVVFFILLVASLFWRKVLFGDELRAPPGPMGVPIFGYLPFLQGNFHLTLNRLAAKYGPVCQLHLGNKQLIILSHHRVIKQAFRLEAFAGRPRTEFSQIFGGFGIVNTEGDLWKEQRRFVHERLRNFGAGSSLNRNILEKHIMKEVNAMLNIMAEKNGQPYDLHHVLACSLSNVICKMLMDVRFDHQDPRFLRFLHLMDEGLRLFSGAAPASYVPILRFVPGINWAYNQIIRNREEMFSFFRQMVEEHKATRDPTKARDFVDEYLMEIDKQVNNNHEEDQKKRRYFSEEQLHQVIADLFSTGLEPVKDTLLWAILHMIINPHVQEKVQEELDNVIGPNRLPSLEDMPYLPYTMATVLEVLRCSNVLGIGSSRRTTKVTELNGYKIPANAHVLPLIWAVHMDEKLWENPKVFDPSRFIDKAGLVTKPDYFLPFSSGRRMCIGEALAKTELYLFLSSILHRFTLTASDEVCVPKFQSLMNSYKIPSQFKVCAILRKPSSPQ